ncbi:ribonuclease Y [bacterium]|nr:ribonuclease Y [bacterium]
MSPILINIIIALLSAVFGGFIIAQLVVRALRKQVTSDAEMKAKDILRDAKREAKDTEKDAERKARDMADSARRKAEQSYQSKLEEASRAEKKAKDLERELKTDRDAVKGERENAERLKVQAERAKEEYDRITLSAQKTEEHYRRELADIQVQLEKVAGMTSKEAQAALIKTVEEEAKLACAKSLKLIEEQTKEDAEKIAKKIISVSISRYASDYIPERTTSAVSLPNDDLKGRLIGREGRNIRALEAATGCDLIIDDTPETVIVSCFDPVRRHVGKTVLEQLIADGRVHPSRIEEQVEKVTKQVNSQIRDAGEKALLELNLVGMHPELVKTIGQLLYRYSYSQNQYYHVIEVGHLCGLMAAELGLDQKKARRAGLLHDIGKALTHETEGSHAVIGADLCKKFGEHPDVVQAIRAHHEDVKPETWMDFLVIAADAISGARPGARREQLDNYVRRLNDLEEIANQYPGVERSFAVAAGRELRVMVENSRVTDEQAVMMSREIATKIEQDMTYPGQIKVTVIRETRATSLAK